MNTNTTANALDRRYFNTTQNYTLAVLNAFDNVPYYVQERDENNNYLIDKVYRVPITFGNYEKSIILQDINEQDIRAGNVNFLPRLVLSFDSIARIPERGTQKFQTFKKKIPFSSIAKKGTPEYEEYKKTGIDKLVLDMSYNSIPYDFNFVLLLQARGMSSATQITESILAFFNPSYQLRIKEFPLFDDFTVTQLLLTSDPEFEIKDEFEETEVNIINVTFNLTLRGNIYRNINYQNPIEVVNMFTHIWDEYNEYVARLSSYYKFDIDYQLDGTHKPLRETLRDYNGTLPYDDTVLIKDPEVMAKFRPDFNPPEIITELHPEKEENE